MSSWFNNNYSLCVDFCGFSCKLNSISWAWISIVLECSSTSYKEMKTRLESYNDPRPSTNQSSYVRTPSPEIMNHFSSLCLSVEQLQSYFQVFGKFGNKYLVIIFIFIYIEREVHRIIQLSQIINT